MSGKLVDIEEMSYSQHIWSLIDKDILKIIINKQIIKRKKEENVRGVELLALILKILLVLSLKETRILPPIRITLFDIIIILIYEI